MDKIYTTKNEERLIYNIVKEGFEFNKNIRELPKYIILRIAIGLALRLEKIRLDSLLWERKKMDGEKGGEYNLPTILGSDDEESMLKMILYVQHKDEIEERGDNIFKNDKFFVSVLDKYIHRGLFEIDNTWKNRDCFYQWCLDHLGFENIKGNNMVKDNSGEKELPERIKDYYRSLDISIEILESSDSFRHWIYRVKIKSHSQLDLFRDKSKNLEDVLGVTSVSINPCNHLGLTSTYDIFISKPEAEWRNLGEEEFKAGIQHIERKPLAILAGYGIDNKPFIFTLEKSIHLFVAGTTGSGKTTFLQCLILSLLISTENCEIVFIDPKHGVSAKAFEKCSRVRVIPETAEAIQFLQEAIDEMEDRYKMGQVGNYPYKIIVVDELNDLILQDKNVNERLSRLALKARQAGIYLVLGTQRPDADTLKGNLRSNIPSRIALKVAKSKDSLIVLDETGAEKLLGRGDMLIKIMGDDTRHIFGIDLKEEQIKNMIRDKEKKF